MKLLLWLICFCAWVYAEDMPSSMLGRISFEPALVVTRNVAYDVVNENASATFITSLSPATRTGFRLDNGKIDLQTFLDIRMESYAQPDTGVLKQPQLSLAGAGLGVGFYPLGGKDFKLSILHTYEQAVIFSGVDLGVNITQRFTIPGFVVAAEVLAFRWEKIKIGAEAQGYVGLSVATPGNTIRHAYGFGGKAWVETPLGADWALQLGGLLKHTHYTTHIVDQDRLSGGVFAQASLTLR